MRVAFVTGIWRRHEIFKLFAKGIKELEKIEGLELITIVAGSEGEASQSLVESYGFEYIEIGNNPLSRKMQSTIKRAKEFDVDYVMCLGSDDIIHPDLMEEYLNHMRKGVDYIGTLDFYFLDYQTGKCSYWGGYLEPYRRGHLCGAGRCLSKNLLDQMGWMVWEGYDGMLDTSMQLKLTRCRYTSASLDLKSLGLYGLDIKSGVNMTPFRLWNNTSYIDPKIIKEKFSYLW